MKKVESLYKIDVEQNVNNSFKSYNDFLVNL